LIYQKEIQMSENPVRIWDYAPVTKYNHNHGAGGRFASGGGGGGSSNPTESMMSAVNNASSLAVQHGDPAMKDVAYSATKAADTANQKMAKGDFSGAKEYMDVANDKLQSLPAMAESAGLDSGIVRQLSSHAKDARAAHTQFSKNDQQLNTLSQDMFNHKQSITPSMRAGGINTRSAQAHIKRGQDIVSQAHAILGGTRADAMNELNRRMGL
jgi:hypothetical protein